MKLIQYIAEMLPDEAYDGEEGVKNFEARIIAEHITGLSYSELLGREIELNKKQAVSLKKIIQERTTLKPLAYILNSITFRDLDLYVDDRVLIPRQETELLVEYALEFCKELDNPSVLDIGTGSGAIALSIVQECKSADVIGIDISKDAIDVANLNLSAVGSSASRVSFVHKAWPFIGDKMFDIIISNPPYIGKDEKESLPKQVLDFEPHIALFADDDGFAIYGEIIKNSLDWLKSNGKLFFEISPRHVERITELSNSAGYKTCQIIRDLTARERLAILAK